MSTKSHAAAWASDAPTPAQLKEFFAQIEAGKITKDILQEFLRGRGRNDATWSGTRSDKTARSAEAREEELQGLPRGVASVGSQPRLRAVMGLRIPVEGVMSDHDAFGSSDTEIEFYGTCDSAPANVGVATYTLDEFTKILGCMVAFWGIPGKSHFARLLEGIHKVAPSSMCDGQRIFYKVPRELYSGAHFMRDPGSHVW